MIASWQEARVLRRAIERGWLSESDLATISAALPDTYGQETEWRFGPRLDALLTAGLLSEEAVTTLVAEVTQRPARRDPKAPSPAAAAVLPPEFRGNDRSGQLDLQLATTLDGKQTGTGTVAGQAPAPLPPALAQWDRYEVQNLLGRGGMGVVYKASDRRLHRTVALKFIHDVGVQTGLRLMREVRAQARIFHPGVCKVHEVGEVAGQLYIAMEYLAGQSLQTAQLDMTLEEKVHVIKDVAEALHAAHQLGIIHRDIKPANVMVERTDDGRWNAVVMDFGLASDSSSSERLTQTGTVMGTPAYMSPEQARGEVNKLDRRSDVYSLGAMLYELLVGKPPFGDGTMVQVLMRVMHEEPQPLRQRNPAVPLDLETITMKCLNKEVQRRYESAQGLAEDLRRYLAAEPILARQPSWHYRIRQTVRKHKFLLALFLLAMLGAGGSLGVWLRAQRVAAQQARLAQQFGQTIKEIEMFLRYAYALPLHDTRIEKKVIRDRMQTMQQRMRMMDGEAAATAHYALGRGHLVLQEFELALEHLEAAHRGGLHTAEVEYALGRTLGEMYNTHFKEVQRRSGKRVLLDKQKIDKQYLEPALHHLRQSTGLRGESRLFAEGLLAYYSQHYEEALKKAQEALAQEPWIYEAKKLQGDVYYAYGFAKQKRGQYKEARSDYRRAAELLHEAAEMGRSDSSIHGSEADLWVQVMDLDYQQGLSPKEDFERALAACDRAIISNPENATAVRKKVWGFIRWAEYQSTHGEDPRAAAKQAISAAEEAILLNPKNAFPYDQMGNAYLLIAGAENDQGQDTTESERHATESFQKSLEVNPMFAWAWNDFGVLHLTKAEWLARRGEEYRVELEASIRKLERAIEADPEYHIAYSNLIDVYRLFAQYEMDHGHSPESWIGKALETSTHALQVNPNFYETYRNLAAIYALRARYEEALGRSPQLPIEKALEHIGQAIMANANDAVAHRQLAQVYALSARHLLHSNRDPADPIIKGLEAIKKSVLITPNSPDNYLVEVQLLLLAAQSESAHGKSPVPTLQQAQGAAAWAHDLNAKLPAVYLSVSEIARATAEWQVAHHQPATWDIAEGLTAIEQALALNPRLTSAILVRGALQLLLARTIPVAARKQVAAQALLALQSFKQALEQNPLLRPEIGDQLKVAQQLSGSTAAQD